eukprot:1923516-Pyramimonas_sp.AAC.1
MTRRMVAKLEARGLALQASEEGRDLGVDRVGARLRATHMDRRKKALSRARAIGRNLRYLRRERTAALLNQRALHSLGQGARANGGPPWAIAAGRRRCAAGPAKPGAGRCPTAFLA